MRVAAPDGAEVPTGEVGELLVRGHVVMKGYHGNPEATAEAIRDGWLHTGDLGYRDADGFLYVVDRIKDLIIRGGFNVYPREVEEVLYGHPAVAEAAVVGRPDERLGEEIVAVVSARPGRRPRHRGADRLLPGAAGRLQVPARGPRAGVAAQERHRQAAQAGAAGAPLTCGSPPGGLMSDRDSCRATISLAGGV